jgi:hypothetical protein
MGQVGVVNLTSPGTKGSGAGGTEASGEIDQLIFSIRNGSTFFPYRMRTLLSCYSRDFTLQVRKGKTELEKLREMKQILGVLFVLNVAFQLFLFLGKMFE